MFQRVRANGPALLVPLAWVVVGAAHAEYVSFQALTIAHGVMAIILAGFVVFSWSDMRSGALRTWWIIVAIGFIDTGRRSGAVPITTFGAAVSSIAGMVLYFIGNGELTFTFAGLALVGVGQTIGIVDAVIRYQI